jgi:hypothetical protein
MANNISKFCALTDFLLLEYEFNKSGSLQDLTGISSTVATNNFGTLEYFNGMGGRGIVNNDLGLNSVPINSGRTSWYCYPSDTSGYSNYFDSSISVSVPSYPFDTVKVHIISGYSFDDVAGFLLQIGAESSSGNLINLSNFTWIDQVNGTDVIKWTSNALDLGGKFYDKYIEFQIPSVQELGGDQTTQLGLTLNVKPLSDVFITYSTIGDINLDNYVVSELISLQLPVTSVADNFNCLIAESTAGDFIEFYATWNDIIIGEYIGDIESGKIRLYTSNNPNDNYQEFSDQYGAGAQKWVVMHEIQVWEQIPGANIMTQKYAFTQEDNFNLSNYFRPVIKNSDIAASYTIDYICRLMNRMDGSQIIRKASFASTDPKKYGKTFTRLNVDNYIPYKVFNRIEGETSTTIIGGGAQKTKFVKVFYDTTTVMLNTNNEILPQGTGPLFLKRGDGLYSFKFDKVDTETGNQSINVDLSGIYNYILSFTLDDNSKIEVLPTYSNNMNTTLGELEFKITGAQTDNLLQQTNNGYSIIVKNPDGTQYTFYEGVYYSYKDFNQVISQFQNILNVTSLNSQIAALQEQVKTLIDENAALKTKPVTAQDIAQLRPDLVLARQNKPR